MLNLLVLVFFLKKKSQNYLILVSLLVCDSELYISLICGH